MQFCYFLISLVICVNANIEDKLLNRSMSLQQRVQLVQTMFYRHSNSKTMHKVLQLCQEIIPGNQGCACTIIHIHSLQVVDFACASITQNSVTENSKCLSMWQLNQGVWDARKYSKLCQCSCDRMGPTIDCHKWCDKHPDCPTSHLDESWCDSDNNQLQTNKSIHHKYKMSNKHIFLALLVLFTALLLLPITVYKHRYILKDMITTIIQNCRYTASKLKRIKILQSHRRPGQEIDMQIYEQILLPPYETSVSNHYEIEDTLASDGVVPPSYSEII